MGSSGRDSKRRVASRGVDGVHNGNLVVVGVGASAGGLEALAELLQHLPPHENLAVVIIQHLDPRHESALPELLSVKTRMPVVPVEQEVPIEGNHVYVIAPNTVLSVVDGRLVPE